ncbi:preprotein translocase subunit YajC [Altererythrobacter salegens]|uniref:Preprotein translocase subunit YajC n=1 Tax=Croceibacterium salegens TaxID=1737568 RepID=A0A6I4SXE3_9SPHN|nr:preprotein translocase subunit YajC [Croceibacterium salegens]MXO59526.1 preprotein translocase subunit YajC [Croceibacterium salegens]
MTGHIRIIALALAALAVPAGAQAQDQDGAQKATPSVRGPHIEVAPYIEAAEVLSAQLDPYSDTVTYTTLAAGVDVSATGRYSSASASLRYERHFANDSSTRDSDAVSGIARASVALGSPNITMEAGGLASQSWVNGDGTAFGNSLPGDDSSTSRIYSVYAGPSIQSREGAIEVEGHYRFGYTKVETPDALVVGASGPQVVDLADESTTHSAQARVGFAPGRVLPVVGVGVGGGWNEQNTSNLDQRVRDRHLRADMTVPVSPTMALVGGVGYEDVEISSRDAVRDPVTNDPVIGPNGRYVTDKSAPRVIAYESDGLIWDAGVMWRPSRRTSLEAFVGKRYDSTTYYGSFAYAPNGRESFNVSVYDGIQTFGGLITDRLAGLPSQFQAIRSPFSGDVGTCVNSTEGGNCIGDAFGSLNSVVYRNRGVSLSYGINMGRTQAGLGIGYDRRKYIAAAGTVLAAFNGVEDEQYWATIYATTQIDRRSSLSANAYGSRFSNGLTGETSFAYSASLAYYRQLIAGLSGTAAVGLDGITRDSLPDLQAASALLGLRYTF